MNTIKLEDLYNLPMNIEHDGKTYSLRIFVTAWDNFCISYVNYDINKIFSVVIDKNAKNLTINTEPDEISTVNTFDEAYNVLYSNLTSWGFIEIEEMLDYYEESNIKPNVDADELEIPELDWPWLIHWIF